MGKAARLQLVARERHQLPGGGTAGEGRGAREEGGWGEEGAHGDPGLDQVVWGEQPLAGDQQLLYVEKALSLKFALKSSKGETHTIHAYVVNVR